MWKTSKLTNGDLIKYVERTPAELNLLTLFVTDSCNYRCKMCHIWGEQGWAHKEPERVLRNQLNIEGIKDFVRSAMIANKTFMVMITGGEPLLYKEFDQLVSYLYINQLPVFLLTNGSLIERQLSTIVKHVTGISVSLDGPPEVHDQIRGNGSFETVCKGIDALIQEKKRKKTRFPLIAVNMVLSKYSYETVNEYVKVLKKRFKGLKIGFQSSTNNFSALNTDLVIHFEPLLFTSVDKGTKYAEIMKQNLDCNVTEAWQGFVEDHSNFDSAKLRDILKKLWAEEKVNYSRFIDIEEYFKSIDNTFGRVRCLAPLHELVVRSNGNVYFCSDYPDYSLGNINESGFGKIWHGERAVAFRKLVQAGNLPVCNRCCRLFIAEELSMGGWRKAMVLKGMHLLRRLL